MQSLFLFCQAAKFFPLMYVGTHAPILFCQSKSVANITEKWLKNCMTSLTFTFVLDVGGVKWYMSGCQSHGGNVRRQLQLGAVER